MTRKLRKERKEKNSKAGLNVKHILKALRFAFEFVYIGMYNNIELRLFPFFILIFRIDSSHYIYFSMYIIV